MYQSSTQMWHNSKQKRLDPCKPHEVANLCCMAAEVLTTNNRLKHLYRISDLYDEILAAAKGEVRAKITTAQVICVCTCLCSTYISVCDMCDASLQSLEPEELEDIKAGLSECSNCWLAFACYMSRSNEVVTLFLVLQRIFSSLERNFLWRNQ